MLYTANLEEIIFQRHQLFESDELYIISGYVGPSPVLRTEELPFKTTVVYGMYTSDGIRGSLHDALKRSQQNIDNLDIYYSQIPVHSKCYVWKNRRNVTHALIGSANFSRKGLNTPFREILSEATVDTFQPLGDYVSKVLSNSLSCLDSSITPGMPAPAQGSRGDTGATSDSGTSPDVCRMTQLDPRTGEVPEASGLNWGQSATAHVNPDDAYVAIRTHHIRKHPEMFPQKQKFPLLTQQEGKPQRDNDSIDMLWDDGATLKGLMEGSQPIDGVRYPKQISTFPNKRDFGAYIRNRIGVPSGSRVTKAQLEAYGRTHIDVSLMGEGIYYFDFSV
jgi:hypothetical protein